MARNTASQTSKMETIDEIVAWEYKYGLPLTSNIVGRMARRSELNKATLAILNLYFIDILDSKDNYFALSSDMKRHYKDPKTPMNKGLQAATKMYNDMRNKAREAVLQGTDNPIY